MTNKESQKKYNKSIKGKAARKKYSLSIKGIAARKRHKATHHYQQEEYRRHIKKHYNLEQDDYDFLLVSQWGKCAICNNDFNFGNKNAKPRVDHNHVTGKVRGLLCSTCNHGIGLLKENIQTLQFAIRYLRRHSDMP